MRAFLLDLASVKLPHTTGTTFADAVKACLLPKDWNVLDHWKAQRVVREEVLAKLDKQVIP